MSTPIGNNSIVKYTSLGSTKLAQQKIYDAQPPSIGLYAIMKDEQDSIGRMLSIAKPFVDKMVVVDTGSTDRSVEIAQNFGAEVYKAGDQFFHPLYEGGIPVFNFDEAKNFALSKLDTDYTIWLDADDELVNGQNIPKILELMEQNKITSMFFRYIYYAEFDERGQIKNIIIEHLRERIVKNDGSHKWIGKIHETLIEQRPTVKSDNRDLLVVHHTNWEKMEKALYRNITTLQEVVISENGKDPRNVYYLGKTFFDLHDPLLHEYTIGLLHQYLDTSGWSEERAQSWTYLSFIHLEQGRVDDAIRAGLMSFYEDPKFPDSYIILALAYLQKRNWENALHWARLTSMVPVPKSTLVVTPKDLQVRILEVIFHACLNTGKLPQAQEAADKLLELSPEDQSLKDRKKMIDELIRDNNFARSIIELVNYFKSVNDTGRAKIALDAIPPHIAKEPSMVALRMDLTPEKIWGDKEIAIYCGPGFEKWGPDNLKTKGLGGSESAVIYMSRELSKLGYQITVFGDPGPDEVIDEGYNVTYKPYFHFTPKDNFNVFISWRQPGIYDLDIKAKKKYVWCHDIQNPADYTPERVAKMDKVLVLSQWQAEPLLLTPAKDKIFQTANGIPMI